MSIDRLQGTDGIRRRVLPSNHPDLAGRTPLEALLEKGVLTEQFFELYAYAFVSSLKPPAEVLIGWDPRDPAGLYTGAAVAGIRKAGGTALVAGILPTPGVAIHLVWRGARAALMITASHNPRDQNGIKIFLGGQALKLFPDDDRALTKRILALDYARDVAPLPLRGARTDVAAEAAKVFHEFHLDPRNSWLAPGETLGEFPLVVDAANGAMSGVAARVFRALHGGEVVEFNHDVASGDVNRKSGVADLEGVPEIERSSRRFAEHKAVQELFRRRAGSAAVFDGDGDRFYRLDYDPGSDRVLVLSGDETAIHQARHLSPPATGTLYVNTVESDLNAARAAQDLGYMPVLTAVGDKWVLQRAVANPHRYGIGGEETGHNISRGWIRTRAGEEATIFTGNGLKSALNTYVATRGLAPREAHRPFPPGFKKTFYVYYTRKELLAQGSDVFRGVAAVIEKNCTLGPVSRVDHPEDPDMLYLEVRGADGKQRAGIFVRNSGTEEKTGVNVRGIAEDGPALTEVGKAAVLHLAATMKDWHHPWARAARSVLEALEAGPLPPGAIPVPEGVPRERLLEEMANKEKVIRLGEKGLERTELGARMLEAWR